MAGFVSFSSDDVFLTVLLGVEAQGRSYGSRVCEEKEKIKCERTNGVKALYRYEYQTASKVKSRHCRVQLEIFIELVSDLKTVTNLSMCFVMQVCEKIKH